MPSSFRPILLLFFFLISTPVTAQDTPEKNGAQEAGTILLADALNDLSERYNRGFIYRSELIENKRVIIGEGANLEEILDDLLSQHNLIAIKIGNSSFVVLPYDEKGAFEGVTIIGGPAETRPAILEGRVQTASGDALQGAQIIIEELGVGDVSTVDGAFKITNIHPGTYTVRISYLGYQAREALVILRPGNVARVDVRLSHDILQLDGVVSTATRAPRFARQSVVSLSVMDNQQLMRLAPTNQADILRGVPGVHTEGGGGEVHANVFIRGLPAPGQYKYSTVEEDGMPLISESGITSAAIDAYFRYDLGIEKLEFARGGSSSLHGIATPVGIINYISKTGGVVPETVIQTSIGERNLHRIDVNTGGPLGEEFRYNVSGFYRYDEGPVVTGLPSEGIQVRGNITRILDNGYVRLYGKYINDSVQFFLPYPHETQSGSAARGNGGELISTLNSSQAANFAFQTPNGVFESSMEDGIATRGPTVMFELVKDIGSGFRIENKTRWTDQNYKARIFLPFPAFQERGTYAAPFVSEEREERVRYVYTDTQEPYMGAYVVDQGAFHWVRPVKDVATRLQLSKSVTAGGTTHDISAGAFLARTTANQRDTEPWILTEFADQPRLLDLVIDHAGDDEIWGTEDDGLTRVTQNGLASASRNYTNIKTRSNRLVLFAGDEVTVDGQLRLDLGLRYEIRNVQYSTEIAEPTGLSGEFGDSKALQGFTWGSGRFFEETIRSHDLAASLGINYTLTPSLNLYGVASRSHFFPQVAALTSSTELGNLDNERFIQVETGFKYGTGYLATTVAIYIAVLDDRFDVDIRADEQGQVRNRTIKIGGSRTIGMEWTWGYIPEGMEYLHFFGDLTYQNHQYRDFVLDGNDFSGNQIERQPQFMLRGGFSFDVAPFSFSMQAKYTGDRFASADNIHRLDGYTLVQADASYTVPFKERQSLRIGLNVFNLLNSRGLTEGDPRLIPGTRIQDQPFFNARPVLPRRSMVRLTYIF